MEELIKMEQQILTLKNELGNIPEITNRLNAVALRKNWIKNSNKVIIGKKAKNFSAKDMNGKEFNLNEVLKKNQYTLLEFWASWCGPCRGDIPHIKKAYGDFGDKGFEVISYSLDHDRDKWVKASKDEGIEWINVSDLRAYKGPVPKEYGVMGVPANFLIDGNGTVVDRNLRHHHLYQKLEELFSDR